MRRSYSRNAVTEVDAIRLASFIPHVRAALERSPEADQEARIAVALCLGAGSPQRSLSRASGLSKAVVGQVTPKGEGTVSTHGLMVCTRQGQAGLDDYWSSKFRLTSEDANPPEPDETASDSHPTSLEPCSTSTGLYSSLEVLDQESPCGMDTGLPLVHWLNPNLDLWSTTHTDQQWWKTGNPGWVVAVMAMNTDIEVNFEFVRSVTGLGRSQAYAVLARISKAHWLKEGRVDFTSHQDNADGADAFYLRVGSDFTLKAEQELENFREMIQLDAQRLWRAMRLKDALPNVLTAAEADPDMDARTLEQLRRASENGVTGRITLAKLEEFPPEWDDLLAATKPTAATPNPETQAKFRERVLAMRQRMYGKG